MDDTDEGGWDRVAERVKREIATRGVSYSEIERDSGFSYKTLMKLLDGEPVTRRDRLAALAHYFGWAGDGFDRIRRGEEPADEIHIDASGVDLEELRQADPESYEQIMGMARLALDRARERRLGR